MDTDRPNITNTPHTIDAGHLQIEAGAADYAYRALVLRAWTFDPTTWLLVSSICVWAF